MDFFELQNINIREMFEIWKGLFLHKSPPWNGEILPSYQITCSCGEKTFVNFHEDVNEYEAVSPNWEFGFLLGWYCGKSGHEQIEYKEV